MTKRIHIGGAPRSGTTLMKTLICTCFDIDESMEDEVHLWKFVPSAGRVACTKSPGDERVAPYVLGLDRDLWFICMLRDPRDVTVSSHDGFSASYFADLAEWRESVAAIRRARAHPRFIVVRYETLVETPDEIQAQLMERMPFLRKTRPFSSYRAGASPSRTELMAMHGLREISSDGVGKWRAHKERLAAQLDHCDALCDALVEFGYEPDRGWLSELEGVVPDTRGSVRAHMATPKKAFYRKLHAPLEAGQYVLRRLIARQGRAG